MGHVGQQPPRQVLRADPPGPASPRRADLDVGTPVRGDGPHSRRAAGRLELTVGASRPSGTPGGKSRESRRPRVTLTRLIGGLRAAAAKTVALLRGDRLDRDFEQELASHLEMAAEDHRRRGLSAEQARRQAVLTLGGVEATRLLHRDTRGVPRMDNFLNDLRYTFRTLRRDLGFSLIAILILGIGIGANTAIFSLVNALLFRPLPFANADRLVFIGNSGGVPPEGAAPVAPEDTPAAVAARRRGTDGGLSTQTSRALDFDVWRERSQSFEDMGAYFAFFSYLSAKLTIGTET